MMNARVLKIFKLVSVFLLIGFIFIFTQNCSRYKFKDLPQMQELNSQLVPTMQAKSLSVTYPGKSYQFIKGIAIENAKPFVTKSKSDSSIRFSVLEPLPSGIVLDESTGELSGTPEEVFASAEFTIQATEDTDTSIILFNIEVVEVGSPLTYQIGSIEFSTSTISSFNYTPKIISSDVLTSPIFYIGNHDLLPKGFSLDPLSGIITAEPPFESFNSKLFSICVADSATSSDLIEAAMIGTNCSSLNIKLSDVSDSPTSSPTSSPITPIDIPSTTKEIPMFSIDAVSRLEIQSTPLISLDLKSSKDSSVVNKNTTYNTASKTVCDISADSSSSLENLIMDNGICLREIQPCSEKLAVSIKSISTTGAISLCTVKHNINGKYGYFEVCNGKQATFKNLLDTIESSKLSNCVDVPNLSISNSTPSGASTSITVSCGKANQNLKLTFSGEVGACDQFVVCDSSSNYTTTLGSFSCYPKSNSNYDGKGSRVTASTVDINNQIIPYYGTMTSIMLH